MKKNKRNKTQEQAITKRATKRNAQETQRRKLRKANEQDTAIRLLQSQIKKLLSEHKHDLHKESNEPAQTQTDANQSQDATETTADETVVAEGSTE